METGKRGAVAARRSTSEGGYRSLGIKSVTTFSGFMDRDWLARYGTKDIELYGKVLKEF